jgi:hypothetical protein
LEQKGDLSVIKMLHCQLKGQCKIDESGNLSKRLAAGLIYFVYFLCFLIKEPNHLLPSLISNLYEDEVNLQGSIYDPFL